MQQVIEEYKNEYSRKEQSHHNSLNSSMKLNESSLNNNNNPIQNRLQAPTQAKINSRPSNILGSAAKRQSMANGPAGNRG